MKSIIINLTVAAFALIAIVPQAEARSHKNRVYISSYTSCGTPVYTERYFIGYDHCGNPVWGYRTCRQTYRPVERPRYVAPCPPPAYYGRDEYRGRSSGPRVVIEGSFRL